MMRIGTCSWAEKTLIASGEFYPREVKTSEARLRYYTKYFDTVEVDSVYYAIPTRSTADLWAMRTPEDFIFHIKVYGALTGHGVDPRTLPHDIRDALPKGDANKPRVYIQDPGIRRSMADRLVDALLPLREAGKLGLLIYQYPPWFYFGTRELEQIASCAREVEGHTVAVEFRHGSWLLPERLPEVLGFLQEHGLVYVTADEPQYGSLVTVPFIPAVASGIAYFRLHGRNTSNWLKKGIATHLRYDYLYSEDELRAFVPHIHEAGKQAAQSYLMFNNCHGGFAVRNAMQMLDIFKREEEQA